MLLCFNSPVLSAVVFRNPYLHAATACVLYCSSRMKIGSRIVSEAECLWWKLASPCQLNYALLYAADAISTSHSAHQFTHPTHPHGWLLVIAAIALIGKRVTTCILPYRPWQKHLNGGVAVKECPYSLLTAFVLFLTRGWTKAVPYSEDVRHHDDVAYDPAPTGPASKMHLIVCCVVHADSNPTV